jgi:hypothetical protein
VEEVLARLWIDRSPLQALVQRLHVLRIPDDTLATYLLLVGADVLAAPSRLVVVACNVLAVP